MPSQPGKRPFNGEPRPDKPVAFPAARDRPQSLTPSLDAAIAAGPGHPVAILLGMEGGLGILLDRFADLDEADRERVLAWFPPGTFTGLIGGVQP